MYTYPQYQIPVQQVYDPKILQNMHCIIEPSDGRGGLYLGDWLATMRTDLLIQYNIGGILSVAFDAKYNKTYDPRIQHIVNKHVIAYDLPSYDISQHFQQCNQWIQTYLSKGVGVLVHCKAGISRSASVVIAYLMKKYNMTFQKAYIHAKSKRNKVSPNQGFKNQLKIYQSKIVRPGSSKSILLRSSNVIQPSLKYSTVREQPILTPPLTDSNIVNIQRPKTPLIVSQQNLRNSAYFGSPQNGSKTQRFIQQQQITPQSLKYIHNYRTPVQQPTIRQPYFTTQPFYQYSPIITTPSSPRHKSVQKNPHSINQIPTYPQYFNKAYNGQINSVVPLKKQQQVTNWADSSVWHK